MPGVDDSCYSRCPFIQQMLDKGERCDFHWRLLEEGDFGYIPRSLWDTYDIDDDSDDDTQPKIKRTRVSHAKREYTKSCWWEYVEVHPDD